MIKITTKSEKETRGIARNIAKELKGGDIIGLSGNLGSGKTVFTKGLAKGFGIKNTITSPTFNIMKIYNVPRGLSKNIKLFCHIDAYRINAAGLKSIGADEYIGNENTVTVIEWADRIKAALPEKKIEIRLTAGKSINERVVALSGCLFPAISSKPAKQRPALPKRRRD